MDASYPLIYSSRKYIFSAYQMSNIGLNSVVTNNKIQTMSLIRVREAWVIYPK